MGRILEFTAEDWDTGLTVRQLLRRKNFTRQDLIRLKYEGGAVFVNGEASLLNAKLVSGSRVKVRLPEEKSPKAVPAAIPVEIIYEDEDVVVVNKPAGMPVHPSRDNRDNTLANALTWYYQQKQIPFVFRCSNRLDRDTSGLTLVAKNVVCAGILSEMGTRRQISREYLAISKCTPDRPWGTIDAPIGRKPGSIIERTIDPEHGERAVTHYELVMERNGFRLIRLKLETGRTHQIRVHLKYLGAPIIGDYLYHPDLTDIGRQALHAWKLSFRHPMTQEKMTFTAPLPDDMARLLL